MTQEATVTELYGNNNEGDQRQWIIASSATIAQGTLMAFHDGRIVEASTTTGASFAGVASHEKEADYSTRISTWTNAILTMIASAATIPLGSKVKIAAPGNYVMALSATDASQASTAMVVGTTYTTAAAGSPVEVRVLM